MSIVTITSDYGANTYYAASLKARLYALIPDVKIVDITHNLPGYDLIQAAFLLQSCIDDFVQTTVHIIAVDTNLAVYQNIIIARRSNNWVICADNGFTPMLDGLWDEVYVVKKELYNENDLSPEKNIFTQLAANIINAVSLDFFCEMGKGSVQADSLKPVESTVQIRASIVHVDGYDNAVTNLSRTNFYSWLGENSFRIYYKRREYLEVIEQNYAKVLEGFGVAVFNDKGWLEIAINKGKGKSLLGLKLGDQIIIEKQI